MIEPDLSVDAEHFLRSLLAFIDDAAIVADSNDNLLFVSPNIVRVLGCSEEEAQSYGTVARLLGGLRFDPDVLAAQGEIRDLHQPVVDAAGNLRLMLIHVKAFSSSEGSRRLYICRDISQQHQSFEELSQFRRVVEQSPSTVVITDTQGHIIYINPRFTTLTGYTAEEAIGQNPRILKSGHTQDEEYDQMWQTISTGGEWRGEFLNKKKNGDLYWESASISPLTNNQGEITHYIAVKEDITERKAAETALRASEARFQALFDRTNDAIFLVDLDYHLIGANRRAAAMLGYTEEEIVGQRAERFVEPEDRNTVRRIIEQLRAGGNTPMIEQRFRHKNGQVVIGEVNVTLVHDAQNEPSHIHAVVRDITQRKAMETALQQSEQNARAFQEYLRRLHIAHMSLARIETLDELCRRTVEVGLEQLGFDRMGLMLVDRETNTMQGTYGTDPQGIVRDEHDYRRPLDTFRYWIEASSRDKGQVEIWHDVELNDYDETIGSGWNAGAALWSGDQVVGYFALDNFIHKHPPRSYEADLISLFASSVGHLIGRKRVEEELRASEKRFRTLLEAAPVGILLVEQNGQIISANTIAGSQFGYSPDDMKGLALEELVPSRKRSSHQQHRADFFEHPTTKPVHIGVGLDSYGQRADGSPFPIEIALSHLELEGSTLAVAYVTDITDRKQAQQQQMELTLERERMNILALFIRNAAHEFRTPLSIINTTLYLMEKVPDAQRQIELRGRIQEHADSITRLVDSLTTMVRLDSDIYDELRPIDANSIVQAAVIHAQIDMEEKGIEYEFHLSDQVVNVNADSADLALAITHVLENAVRYTPSGQRISVTTECRDGSFIITISDTGIGMTEDAQAHIFERFYRADYARTTRGFGLGLSIAHKIVEYHGGDIIVESVSGQGSTFRITLPLSGEQFNALPSTSRRPPRPSRQS